MSPKLRRHVPALLGLAWLALPCAASAAAHGHAVGLKLLQAQLPAGASVQHLGCERLERAEHAATLAHKKQAVEILAAALSLDEGDERRHAGERFSCACVVRLFLASVSAAPDESVALLETTEALYPECADDLTAGLRRFQASEGRNGEGAGLFSAAGGSTESGGTNGGDGFGAGLGPGPGFPGSPGFSGSSPSGGLALPTPVPVPVTSAVNN